MPTVVLRPLFHRRQEVIAMEIPKRPEIALAVRKLKGAKWSQTQKVWYLPLTKDNYEKISGAISPLAAVDSSLLKAYLEKRRKVGDVQAAGTKPVCKSAVATVAWKLSAENLAALNLFIEQLQLRAYSSSTIKTYRNEFLQLLHLLKRKPVAELTPDDLRRYFVYCLKKLKLTENTLHSRINAIKFYFEQVLKRDKLFWEIPRPKKQQQLPRFFNQSEIAAIINASGNVKHKTMLMLAYSSGLRVSEVVAIKTNNIDSKRMSILIEQAKGKKDRMVKLSPILLVMLREYWKKYKPANDGYLFTGQSKGKTYSSRSLQLVLAAAKKKAGIMKPGSIHALRHSFATHLLDKGTDVTLIMKLLGHNDIKTTLRYLHVTNRDILDVKSPLDDLQLKD